MHLDRDDVAINPVARPVVVLARPSPVIPLPATAPQENAIPQVIATAVPYPTSNIDTLPCVVAVAVPADSTHRVARGNIPGHVRYARASSQYRYQSNSSMS